ncbi:hypothetical protein ILUMI_13742 [Ignelater luminosus]|uniref:BED-type domain-containing protein n=1 Tax=Ignelater luminosus TaxID=2038154 RepID=A0A8K0CTU9_IGNLU|nr:hypothetical protein ILUMI_13742 [Ignelater luminosus]
MTSKKKSSVWVYFEENDEDSRKVQCKVCGIKISRGGIGKKASTSDLINHLKNKHKEEYQKIQKSISTEENKADDVISCSIVKDSLKVQPEVKETIAAGRRIITNFNHSGTAQEEEKE